MVIKKRKPQNERTKMMSLDTLLTTLPRVHVVANRREHAVPQEAA